MHHCHIDQVADGVVEARELGKSFSSALFDQRERGDDHVEHQVDSSESDATGKVGQRVDETLDNFLPAS